MKKKYLILFIITLVIFTLFRIPYRNYIYKNHIFDFHIADTAPNFFAVFLFVFLKKSGKESHNNLLLIFCSFLVMVLYEYFIQKYMGLTIDPLDIIASFFGCLLVFFICKKIDLTSSSS